MQVQNISFYYEGNSNWVLKNTSFGIEPKEHMALVGPNGSGKTTLLKILSGELNPQSGLVHRGNQEILYLPQEIFFSFEISVKNWLFDKLGLSKIYKELRYLEKVGLENSTRLKKWGDLRQRFENLDGDNFEVNLSKAIRKVPLIDFKIDQKINTLSGGQMQRLKLLLISLARHDIVLMDEPTNDLDKDGIDWLKKWINHTKSGIIIVSHNRDLLNKVINHIVAIDSESNKIFKARCSYNDFLSQVNALQNEQWSNYLIQKKQIKDLKKEISNAQSKVGRSMGKKDRLDRDKRAKNFRAEKGSGKSASKVRKLKNELAQIVRIEAPKHYEMRLDYEFDSIKSPIAIHFKKLATKLGSNKFGLYSGDILSKDRLAIIGPNGSGKTTFLKMLLNKIERKGKVAIARDANIFFIPQTRWFSLNKTVWGLVSNYIKVPQGEAKSRLTQFGLPENTWSRNIASLSPGERTRLLSCLINLQKPNFLILDEPTNHMDVEAIETMEKGLRKFKGTLVIVSHDQTFLKNIGINKVWKISFKKIKSLS